MPGPPGLHIRRQMQEYENKKKRMGTHANLVQIPNGIKNIYTTTTTKKIDPKQRELNASWGPYENGFGGAKKGPQNGAAKKKSSSKPAAATGKVRTGPRGGKFVLRNGHKVYV